MIPFITEEIWQLLGQVAPQRGLEQLHPAAESIMIAPWPKVSSQWRDHGIEKQIGEFQQILRVVRDIRQQNDISPREKLEFGVRCEAQQAARLKPLEAYFQKLANATVTAWGPKVEAPKRAGKASVAGAEIYVDLHHFIDVEKETARLTKEADKLEKLIEGKKKKLENANFVANAPADVVQKERDSLSEWQTQLGSIRTALSELAD
jgi:valyl-tRNA synthetase